MAELRSGSDVPGDLGGQDKAAAISAVGADAYLKKNTRLMEAVRALITALPDNDRDVRVVLSDDSADDGRHEHTITVTVSSTAVPKDDTTYDTARNDSGERTDINARVVGTPEARGNLSKR